MKCIFICHKLPTLTLFFVIPMLLVWFLELKNPTGFHRNVNWFLRIFELHSMQSDPNFADHNTSGDTLTSPSALPRRVIWRPSNKMVTPGIGGTGACIIYQ